MCEISVRINLKNDSFWTVEARANTQDLVVPMAAVQGSKDKSGVLMLQTANNGQSEF